MKSLDAEPAGTPTARSEGPGGEAELYKLLFESSHDAIFALDVVSGLSAVASDETRARREGTVREQVEEELKQSEHRFRRVRKSLPQLVWTCRGAGSCEYLSPQWVDYTGIPEEQQLGYAWLEQVHPEDRERIKQDWQTAARRGERFESEFRIRRQDGEYRWFQTLAAPLRDNEGKVQTVLCVSRDVTEQQRTEEQLRLQAAALKSAANAIVITDREGSIQWVNEAFTRLTGYGAEEVAGVNPRALKSGAHSREFYERMWRTISAGRIWRGEIINKRKDGALYPEEMTITPVLDHAGRITHYIAIKHDISERKRAEEQLHELNATLERRVAERTTALQESESHVRAIVNTAADGILTLDECGRIESVNPAALKMFGYAADEVLGKNIGLLLGSRDWKAGDDFLARFDRAAETQVPDHPREETGHRKDGSLIAVELIVSGFTHGGRRGFVAMLHDSTTRKRLERELLEVADRERTQIGHELHDDLGQILHGAHFLTAELAARLKRQGIAEGADLVRVMHFLEEAASTARGLARGLQPVQPIAEGLMNALRDHTARVRKLYKIKCRFLCPKPAPVADATAATHLFRIAQEAVTNAVKHSRCKEIVVRLAANAHGLALSVKDDGHGQFSSGSRRQGMGLHIMQFRAAAINGKLLVHRTPGVGTEVICTVDPFPREPGVRPSSPRQPRKSS